MIEFIVSKLEDHYKSPSKDGKNSALALEAKGQQGTFFMDFSTALLANILHSRLTQDYLIKNPDKLTDLANRLLAALKQKKIATSTMIHILISLSFLNK